MWRQMPETLIYLIFSGRIYFSLLASATAAIFMARTFNGRPEQVDEAFCVVVVVQIAGGEACQALIVQGVRRGGASFDDVAFVELEFYFAGDILLGGLYESLYSLAERCEHFPSYTMLANLLPMSFFTA